MILYPLRVAGDNRYETAVQISQTAYPHGAETVIIATGLDYPDALAGSALAALLDAPILLVRDREVIIELVMEEIERLGAEKAIILGGLEAVSIAVEDCLAQKISEIERLAGKNRYETAALIAERVGIPSDGHVFLASGKNYPDALAIGTVSGRDQIPVLLTHPTIMLDELDEAITSLGIKEVTIIGGPDAVGSQIDQALSDLSIGLRSRVAGDRREETASRIAETYFRCPEKVIVANGWGFADALVGGYYGAIINAPILLARDTRPTLAEEMNAFLDERAVMEYHCLGGPVAVNDTIFALLADRAKPRKLAIESYEMIDLWTVLVTFEGDVKHRVDLAEPLADGSNVIDFVFRCFHYSLEMALILPSTYSLDFDLPEYVALEDAVDTIIRYQSEIPGNSGYEHVHLVFQTKGPEGSAVAVKLRDDLGHEWSFVNEGIWGPVSGFELPVTCIETLDGTFSFDMKGVYTLTFTLINVDDGSVIAKKNLSTMAKTAEEIAQASAQAKHTISYPRYFQPLPLAPDPYPGFFILGFEVFSSISFLGDFNATGRKVTRKFRVDELTLPEGATLYINAELVFEEDSDEGSIVGDVVEEGVVYVLGEEGVELSDSELDPELFALIIPRNSDESFYEDLSIKLDIWFEDSDWTDVIYQEVLTAEKLSLSEAYIGLLSYYQLVQEMELGLHYYLDDDYLWAIYDFRQMLINASSDEDIIAARLALEEAVTNLISHP